MKPSRSLLFAGVAAVASTFSVTNAAYAHPHVFVEANIEVVRDKQGNFTELRQVWRFDELFSTTIVIDYDQNVNGELDPDELKEVTDIVKESIAEYDFYTAIRSGVKPLEFYEPDEIGAYFDDGKLIMFLSVEPVEPYDFAKAPLRISASDTSYYVAFDFGKENVSISGNQNGCKTDVVHPDFDKLYAENAETFTEAFFNDPTNGGFGDEFYSWATITCS
ncbi:MAG: DUF1007 family protein [Pseudomonadota bacterium]